MIKGSKNRPNRPYSIDASDWSESPDTAPNVRRSDMMIYMTSRLRAAYNAAGFTIDTLEETRLIIANYHLHSVICSGLLLRLIIDLLRVRDIAPNEMPLKMY